MESIRKVSMIMAASVILVILISCTSNVSVSSNTIQCVNVELVDVLTSPKPWDNKVICVSGKYYKDNGGFDTKTYLSENVRYKDPNDRIIFLSSFLNELEEEKISEIEDGVSLRVKGTLTYFEDCWNAEELGNKEDRCIPVYRPIFLDDIEVISVGPNLAAG